jgi:hypothetical protein
VSNKGLNVPVGNCLFNSAELATDAGNVGEGTAWGPAFTGKSFPGVLESKKLGSLMFAKFSFIGLFCCLGGLDVFGLELLIGLFLTLEKLALGCDGFNKKNIANDTPAIIKIVEKLSLFALLVFIVFIVYIYVLDNYILNNYFFLVC